MTIWLIYRDTEQPQEKETSENESRLQFSWRQFQHRDNVRATVTFRRERQPHHLKIWFFLKNWPIHFHINSTSVIRPIKWKPVEFSQHWHQPAFSCPSSQCLIDEIQVQANSSCCHKSDAWSHLESTIIRIDKNIADNIIRNVINV